MRTPLGSTGCRVVLALSATAVLEAQTTERASVDAIGRQARGSSSFGSISGDGRFVAFSSFAANIVPGDTNGVDDVFVHDRQTNRTERISVSSDGSQGDFESLLTAVSADGRYIAFESWATNLVSGDTNGAQDIFVRDRQLGTTERVSVASSRAEGDGAWDPAISADGRYVAFASHSISLVGGDTNGVWDVFVHDRTSGVTERVSVDSLGVEGNDESTQPTLSADGRFVAFASHASNLVAGDTNGVWDIFVRDRAGGTTERASVASLGIEGDGNSFWPALSADGRYLSFESQATTFAAGDSSSRDVFVRDRQAGTTLLASVASTGEPANADSWSPALSADGHHVAFASGASNLVSGDTNGEQDVFVHDLRDGTTERVSLATTGAEGNALANLPRLSADGRCVAFESLATNLVPGDTNGTYDVFVRERCALPVSASFSGDGLNVDVLTPMDARIGQSWSAPLLLGHGHGAGGSLVLVMRTSTFNGPNFTSPIGGRATELLIAGPRLALLTGTHDGSSGDIPPQTIPDRFSLVGLSWAAQYTVMGGGFADLSTASAGIVGCP